MLSGGWAAAQSAGDHRNSGEGAVLAGQVSPRYATGRACTRAEPYRHDRTRKQLGMPSLALDEVEPSSQTPEPTSQITSTRPSQRAIASGVDCRIDRGFDTVTLRREGAAVRSVR